MTERGFRFGLDIGENVGRDEFVALVRRAEASGFSVVTGPDHVGSRLAAVLPMLMAAAEVSPSIRVSPMVLANDFRHPVVLAKDAATIDILSEGRFELGIGTGWIKHQYEAAGVTYESARTRVDRFEEAIAVIKGCWSGEPFSFTGDHYQVKGVTCPRPIQQPRPPILIAGAGPRMLKIAGREADIVSIAPLTPGSSTFERFGSDLATSGDRVAAQVDWIRQEARPRFDDIELSVFAHHVTVTDDADQNVQEFAAQTQTTPDEVAQSPHVLIGSTPALVETLLDRRERYGLSYVVFGSDDLNAVEPIVSQLAGQ
ncbi:MAG: TIGR03621 family F420-dependent LLM class oxidoreductase [Actinomycetota bacterium]